MTQAQLASLAASLRDNDAFQEAMAAVREDALERLASIKYEDRDGFYTNQAIVKVVDEFCSTLDQFIRSGAEKKPPGIA